MSVDAAPQTLRWVQVDIVLPSFEARPLQLEGTCPLTLEEVSAASGIVGGNSEEIQ